VQLQLVEAASTGYRSNICDDTFRSIIFLLVAYLTCVGDQVSITTNKCRHIELIHKVKLLFFWCVFVFNGCYAKKSKLPVVKSAKVYVPVMIPIVDKVAVSMVSSVTVRTAIAITKSLLASI